MKKRYYTPETIMQKVQGESLLAALSKTSVTTVRPGYDPNAAILGPSIETTSSDNADDMGAKDNGFNSLWDD